jgi:hypothetical protein
MYSLDTLLLIGNPIVNSFPKLAKIENNVALLKKTLDLYFNQMGITSSGAGGLASGGGNISAISNNNNVISIG